MTNSQSLAGMFSERLIVTFITVCCCLTLSSQNKPVPHVTSSMVSCFGKSDGAIQIEIPKSSVDYSVTLYKYKPDGKQLNSIVKNDSIIFLASKLDAGIYSIVIKGSDGFNEVQKVEVKQAPQLKANKISVEKKLSASEAGDAVLKATASGGNLPYTFNWNIDGEVINTNVVTNIKQGIYTCTINDTKNCGPVKTTILFNQTAMPDIVTK